MSIANQTLTDIPLHELGHVTKPEGAIRASVVTDTGVSFGHLVGTTCILDIKFICILKNGAQHECILVPTEAIHLIKIFGPDGAKQ